MIVIKIIISILIVALTAYIGSSKSRKLKEREYVLREMVTFLKLVENEIKYMMNILPNAYEIARQKLNTELKIKIGQIVVDMLDSNNMTYIEGSIEKNISEVESLEKYDKDIIISTLKNLGRSDIEGQINIIQNTINILENQINEANEIKNTNEVIKEVINEEPVFLRPPYGNTNQNIKNISNMYTILWNLDTEDWKYKNAEKISNYIVDNAKDGSIVLLHDLYETSVDGALLAMEKLEKEGYAFVTIDELAKLKNIELKKEKSYYQINN